MQKHWRKYLKLKQWPLAAFIVVAVVTGNILAVTYYISYQQIREGDKWVTFTQGNIARVLEFSATLQEAIVAQHSYLSLGREELKKEAIAKFDAVPERLSEVVQRVKYEDSQNALAEMRFETDALLKMSQEFIKARERGDLAAAYDPKASSSFFALADHIQENANRVRQTEKRLLDQRFQEASNRQTYYVSMMLAASLFSLAVVIFISWLMLRLRTRQTLVEDELKEARERFDLAMRGTSDGIYDWNLRTDDFYLSPRLKEMYGYKPHELENRMETMKSLIHPEDFAAAEEQAKHYLAQEIPAYQAVFRVLHKDGTFRWILSRGAAVWNNKNVATRMVGTHADITSLKEMEEELREAKVRADSANRAKTNFLANMSHEIRTPMNAIIGIAGILRKRASPKAPEREYIDALSIASKSLFALINDLLDLSKLDSGALMLEQVPFDVREMLESATTMARVRAEEKKIGLYLHLSPALPPQLVGDPHRFSQIITNLLSNAVKFTDQGEVNLSAGLTPIGHLEIRVKDTGIGIPKESQRTIFEKFTQSDPSITRRFGGTGLGLSICRELCELMGGEIELISSEGKGTEFIVTLPLPTAPSLHEIEVSESRQAAKKSQDIHGKILVVEDYKPNILVARTALASLGFSTDVAMSGHEALAKLTQPSHSEYVAVLMDVQLPDISGVEATQQVRAHEAEQQLHPLPIIAMTAHALMGDREKFIAAGMNAYIPKPFDPEDLAEKLRALALKPAATEKPKRPAARKASKPAA